MLFPLFRHLFPEHIERRLDDLHTTFRQIYTRIQFKADQKDQGIQVQPDHNDDQRTNRAVDLVIRTEVVDVKRETPYREEGQDRSQPGASTKKLPFFCMCRTILVQDRDRHEIQDAQQSPSGEVNDKSIKSILHLDLTVNVFQSQFSNEHGSDTHDHR